MDTDLTITSIGEDEAGNLWVTDYNDGHIWMIADTAEESTPAATASLPTGTPTASATATPIVLLGSNRLFVPIVFRDLAGRW